jgi:hypothetical protein
MGYPEICSDIILGMSMRAFLDEINIYIAKLSSQKWVHFSYSDKEKEQNGCTRRNSSSLTAC